MGKTTKKIGKAAGRALMNSLFEDEKATRDRKRGVKKACRRCGGTGRLSGMKHANCGGTGYVDA